MINICYAIFDSKLDWRLNEKKILPLKIPHPSILRRIYASIKMVIWNAHPIGLDILIKKYYLFCSIKFLVQS